VVDEEERLREVARALANEVVWYRSKVATLFDALKQGDDVQQDWLRDKIAMHFNWHHTAGTQ